MSHVDAGLSSSGDLLIWFWCLNFLAVWSFCTFLVPGRLVLLIGASHSQDSACMPVVTEFVQAAVYGRYGSRCFSLAMIDIGVYLK